MSKVGDTLKQFAPAIEADAKTYLDAEKSNVIAALKTAQVSAITEIGAIVVGGLDHTNGFEKIVAGPIAKAIENQEPAIIAALGGEDEALYALAEHAIETALDDVLVAAERL